MDVDMTMGFNDYQKVAHETAKYPVLRCYEKIIDERGTRPSEDFARVDYIYATLGLAGEAGEVAEKVKKLVRNQNGAYSDDDAYELAKELGDVLWYVAELCSCLGLKMDDVAHANLNKLADRAKRNVIKSEGDDR